MNKVNNKKIVIAISSSALFDLREPNKIYREEGIEKYKEFQEKNLNKTLGKGVAFPFIRRLLKLNDVFPNEKPVEVILLSRNSHETGLRIFNSIDKYGLNISKAAFFSGESPHKHIPAFGASLFLSANARDVRAAIEDGYAAGIIIHNKIMDDEKDQELRIALDYDGVLADDASQIVHDEQGLKEFTSLEQRDISVPHGPGPLKRFMEQIARIRQLEITKQKKDKAYKRIIKIAIITAREAPSHARMVNTLKIWGIPADESFFLGGASKKPIIETLQPHIYFDDQYKNLGDIYKTPLVHVPFGKLNKLAD